MGLYTRAGKRALDVTGAGLMAAVTAPVMGVIAVALWRTQGRPILFTQQRVGRDDREFTIYKFHHDPRRSTQGAGLGSSAPPASTRSARIARLLLTSCRSSGT
jgi:lipopolysaccharide/colanic/teichoic acid biosynthesis glycosyltransferase